MADPFIGRPFSMPMMKPFIPKALQPWIYMVFAAIYQMVNVVYLGSMSHMVGSLSLMREDVMMIAMFGIVGVAMPFPFLFRLKFRFTNRQLLLFSTSGMLLCNVLATFVTFMPLLCVLSFACCFMKLMGTFECMSNIQLWMTPRRDFRIFFPLLYIIVLGDMSLSAWIAQNITYFTGQWQMMQWFVAGLLTLILIFCVTCLQDFRFMRPLPFISIDWLGMLLWATLLLEIIFIFNYGEYYNWWDSTVWRMAFYAIFPTAWICIRRMVHIRHPYIDPAAFRYKTLAPIMLMFAVCEWMNATPNVLENAFRGSVLHYGMMTTSRFNLISIVGNVTGCLFCLWWMKMLHQKYTRLLTVGFFFLLVYQVMMYFYITPTLNIERLYFPTFIRAFGYTIFFVTLTIYLEDLMPFQHFFMGLTMAGFVRNGPMMAFTSGVYEYMLRYHVADNLSSGMTFTPAESVMMGIKQLYGVTCIIGSVFMLLLMLYHVQPVRSTLNLIPYWNVIGREMRKELQKEAH